MAAFSTQKFNLIIARRTIFLCAVYIYVYINGKRKRNECLPQFRQEFINLPRGRFSKLLVLFLEDGLIE